MATIFGEFLVDSLVFLFPMIRSFQMEGGRIFFWGGREKKGRNKTNVRSDPFKFLLPRTLLWLAADAVSPMWWLGFLLFLGLRFELLLVPLVVRLLWLLLPLLLLLLWLLLLVCRLGEGALLLEWESCLQNQLGRLVAMEKTSALTEKKRHQKIRPSELLILSVFLQTHKSLQLFHNY